ncbi:MAG TPA: DUF2750 domain-containing protein [Saprospiraceae bacterium]|nr:DUF2750 domain-containing protein [Saprospiraceae bacterium]HND88350.1 DUF2750 domain-containing protein [Saprospiraceae bacterium]
MHLTQKQIEEILAKKPENRYKYFIKTVAAQEEVWGLADEEGWLMLEVEGEEQDALAVFPNSTFAEIFQKAADFGDMHVEVLDLSEFMEWLDDMETEGLRVAVFPTPNFQSAVMRPTVVIEDFEKEFEKEKGE